MRIVIEGNPIPKARARHSRRGGKIRTFDPQKRQKETVQLIMKSQKTYRFRAGAALCVKLTLGIPIQKNCPKTQKNAKLWHFEKPTQKPDIDNFAKFYFDCANGILWDDDTQIVKTILEKKYSDNPKTEMIIMPEDCNLDLDVEKTLSHFSPDELKEFLKDAYNFQTYYNDLCKTPIDEMNEYQKFQLLTSAASSIEILAEKYAEILTKIKKKKTAGQGKTLC